MDALCRLEMIEMARRAVNVGVTISTDDEFLRGFKTCVSYILLQMGERTNLPVEIEMFNIIGKPDPSLVGQAMIMIDRRNRAWDAYAKSFMSVGPDDAETQRLKAEYDVIQRTCVDFYMAHKAEWVFALGGVQPET